MSSLTELNTAEFESEALKVIVDNFPILFDQLCQENDIVYFDEDFLDEFILSFLKKSGLNCHNLFRIFIFFQKIVPDGIPDSFFENAQNLKKHRFFFKSNIFNKNNFTEEELNDLFKTVSIALESFSESYSFFFHNLKLASEHLKELSFFPQTDDIKLFRRQAEKKFNDLIYKEKKLTLAYENILLMVKEIETEIIGIRQAKIQQIFAEEMASFLADYRQDLRQIEQRKDSLQNQSPTFLNSYSEVLVLLIRFFPKYLQLIDLLNSPNNENVSLVDLEKRTRHIFEKLYPKNLLPNNSLIKNRLLSELRTKLSPEESAIIEFFFRDK